MKHFYQQTNHHLIQNVYRVSKIRQECKERRKVEITSRFFSPDLRGSIADTAIWIYIVWLLGLADIFGDSINSQEEMKKS